MEFIVRVVLCALLIGTICGVIYLLSRAKKKAGETSKGKIVLRLQKYEEGFKLMAEHEAEEKRIRYKGDYEVLADSAAEVGERTDLDRT